MRSIESIQQEVLSTAQVTLDELKACVEKFWEEGWNRYQEAKRLYKSTDWYITNHERIVKDYGSTKRLYTMIAEGSTPNINGDLPTESDKAYAQERLLKNETSYSTRLSDLEVVALRRQYFSLCGFVHEDEIVYEPGQTYRNNPAIIKNAEISKSGVLGIFFHCKSREEFEHRRDYEAKIIIENATFKLLGQVEKKLAPIKDDVQFFNLISFKGQHGNYTGEWEVITDNGEYLFKTTCIRAGGHNIQCLHIRYLGNLKKA